MYVKHLYTTILFLLLSVVNAVAQNNTLSIPDVSVAQGRSISLPIQLDNTADVVAVQFTLTLPNGLTLTPSTAELTERAEGLSVTMNQIADNKYMAMVYSMSNECIKGRAGKLMSVKLNAASSLYLGAELPLTLSDVVIGARNGANLTTGFSAGKVTISKSPDLEVSKVAAGATTVTPNGKMNVSWQVANVGGASSESGWSEQVYLVTSTNVSKLLTTLYYDGTLNAGGVVSRNAEINVPNVLGIDDKAYIKVKITAKSSLSEPSGLEDNNTATSANAVDVAKLLTLSPEVAEVEEASTKSVRFHISRSGNTNADETFVIKTTKADSRIILPESVIIRKGQSGAYFYAQVKANKAIDSDSLATFTVSGNSYALVKGKMVIEDDTYPNLSISSKVQDVTEGGNIVLTISTDRVVSVPLEIKLTNDLSSRFTTPASIAIPAGKNSIDVTIEAIDDDVPNLEEVVTFTASAPRHNPASMNIVLIDNDLPTLQLEITPSAVSEAAGPMALTATLRRTDNYDKKVTVKLYDDSDGAIFYSRQTIEMAAGEREVTVNLGPIDNTIVDGERHVEITAAVYLPSCNCSANAEASGGVVSTPITLLDNDGPTLSLTSNVSIVKEGGDVTVTLRRNTETSTNQVVSISIDKAANFDFPTSVTIPAGKSEVSFVVKSKTNSTQGDAINAMIIAEASGFTKGMMWFSVSDQTLPDAQFTSFTVSESEVVVGEAIKAYVTVANSGAYELPSYATVNLCMNSSRNVVGELQLPAALAIGESVTLCFDVVMPKEIGSYHLFAEVNKSKAINELQYNNNTSATVDVKCVSPFSVSIQTDKKVYTQGENVSITGKVNGANANYQNLEVYLLCDGIRHTLNTTINADGSFKAIYTPVLGLMGHFSIGACFPGENLKEEMNSFDYYGLRMSQSYTTIQMGEGDTYNGKFTLTNTGLLAQTGLKVAPEATSENCTFSYNYKKSFAANETVEVEYSIKANAKSEGVDWQEMPLTITTNEGVTLKHTLYYYVQTQHATLSSSVSNINTTLCIDQARDFPITLTNIGKGETGAITLQLPSFMKNLTPTINSLASGESVTIVVGIEPTADMVVNVPVYGNLGVNCENGNGISIAYNITPVSDKNGTLEVDVVDEFTYFTDEAPHVSNAEVKIKNPATNAVVAEGKTGADGKFKATIPEGLYNISVTVDKHDSYSNSLILSPGKTTTETVFLAYQAISYSWEVEETEVEDEYVVETVVKYETRVPKPVVIITLPEESPEDGSVFPIIITNQGLVQAEDVKVSVDVSDDYTLELLNESMLQNLAPQQSHVFYATLKQKDSADTKRRRAASLKACLKIHTYVYYINPCPGLPPEKCEVTRMWGDCGSNSYGGFISSSGGNGSGGNGSISSPYGGGANGMYLGSPFVSPIRQSFSSIENSNYSTTTETCIPPSSQNKTKEEEQFEYSNPNHPIVSESELKEIEDDEDPFFMFKLVPVNGTRYVMKGVATDGKSRIKIVLDPKYSKVPSKNARYSYSWSLSENIGSFVENDDCYTDVIYEAPDVFPNDYDRLYKLIANFTYSKDGISNTIPIEIELVRTPIVMVHGLNSSPSTWDSMSAFLEPLYNKFQIYKVDYEGTHNDSFESNKDTVGISAKKEISLRMFRSHFIASSVDVIGHSMGGLLTKKYIQNHGGDLFHKVITINTPHGGSQLGNFICDPRVQFVLSVSDKISNNLKSITPNSAERLALRLFYRTFLPSSKSKQTIFNGAVADLSVGGDAIKIINNNYGTSSVKCHAITSITGMEAIENLSIKLATMEINKDLVNSITKAFGYKNYNDFFSELYNGESSDLIVPITSQEGGLTNLRLTKEVGDLNYCHVFTLDNPVIHEHVKKLLQADRFDKEMFSDGFKEVKDLAFHMKGLDDVYETYTEENSILPKDIKKIHSHRIYNNSSSTDPFIISYNGYKVGHKSINVKVDNTNDTFSDVSFGCFFGDKVVSLTNSNEGTIALPTKSEGNLCFIFEGVTKEGDWYSTSDTIYFNTMATVDHLECIDDTIVVFNNFGISPRINCHWDDGDVKECDCVVSIEDPRIAKIVDGQVYGVKTGITKLLARYLDKECLVPIIVLKADNDDSESSTSICSSISLSFKQSMVMTRQAFRGTLTVNNGNMTGAMKDVKLNLEVKDKDGNVATSHEFQINPESLNGFEGELDFNSGWSLNGGGTGVATIMFIPTKYAAPTEAVEYSFGGTLSYLDPTTNLMVTRKLSPVTLTVKPSPNLDLTYFMQRDIIGDDPLTEEVEACKEAEFSLLINNVGYGDATKVQMVTNQPEIVENEKGLKIDFELMSSQLNGGDKTLALGGSVATDFGTIPAHSTTYAQWWIKSSLLGHFNDYDVKATHVTSYGNPDLSLLNNVTIHELIRSIDVGEGENRLKGFMTNDIADANDTPDMLYLSNGEIESIATAATASIVKLSKTTYELTVTPSATGWNYGNVLDPTYGLSELKSIIRKSDKKAISQRNIWQTDRTLRDGKDPLYENRIHFADLFQSTAPETYILTVEPTPAVLLSVASIEGVPQEGKLAIEPVESVNVMFNKYIDPATFTSDDITFAVQGVKQDATKIGITTQDNKTFKLDFTELNKTTANGYYVLTIQTADITDDEEFQGKTGASAGWIMFRDGLVQLKKAVYPKLSGEISHTNKDENASRQRKAEGLNDDNADYGSTLLFSATPAEGYQFTSWTLNGEVISTEQQFEYTALSDIDITANFSKKSYAVTINKSEGGGTNDCAGYYSHGDKLTITAQPSEFYTFTSWTVDGKPAGTSPQLTVTVDHPVSITPNFTREIYQQKMTLAQGWNWVSSYVQEALPVSELFLNVNRIVSQLDEVVKDPQYGMIGGFSALTPTNAYKIEASYATMKTFNGHLLGDEYSSINLRKGWNWIGYPWNTAASLSDAITGAREGDRIVAQTGFAEYADGYWEGSLNTLTPGQGYLYQTAAINTISIATPAANAQSNSNKAMKSAGHGIGNIVDIHKYPNAMSVTANLFSSTTNIGGDNYIIYAMAGDECRGMAQCTGSNYYLSVYGDAPVEITFVIEDTDTGESFIANESLLFCNDAVGSRKTPYRITVGEASSTATVLTDGNLKIYSLEGILLYDKADRQMLRNLKRGIYIVNGHKYLVR